jgi:hypothetical protein
MITIVLPALLISCSKDIQLIINQKPLWDCTEQRYNDSAKVAKDLIGTWKWTAYWNEIEGNQKANKDVRLTFSPSGTFAVTENSSITTKGNWYLKKEDGSKLGLAMDTACSYLYGRILLCDNEVLFNSSYIDGSDYLFERIK